MRTVSLLAGLLSLGGFLTGCGSSESENFGVGFNANWVDGGTKVLWQERIGAVQRGFVPGIDGPRVCTLSLDGQIRVFDLHNGSTISNAQAAAGSLRAGGNCRNGRVAAVLENGSGIMLEAASGKTLWQASLPAPVLGAPVLSGDSTIFILTNGEILAYSANSGERLWSLSRPTPRFRFSGLYKPLLLDNELYLGFPSGIFLSLLADSGIIVWQTRLHSLLDPDPTRNLSFIGAPSTNGSIVCAVAFRGDLGCFARANGEDLWRRQVSSLGALATGQLLYVIDENGILQARTLQSGELAWQVEGASADRSPEMVVAGPKVVLADGFSGLSLYDAAEGFRTGGTRLAGEPLALAKISEDRVLILDHAGTVLLLEID